MAGNVLAKAREAQPNNPTVYLQLAGFYNRQEEFPKMIEALTGDVELALARLDPAPFQTEPSWWNAAIEIKAPVERLAVPVEVRLALPPEAASASEDDILCGSAVPENFFGPHWTYHYTYVYGGKDLPEPAGAPIGTNPGRYTPGR